MSQAKIASRHELRIIRVGKTFQAIRFKAGSGESWSIAVDKFEKLGETGAVAPGDYEITFITDDVNCTAFRINRLTGETWQLKNQRWLKVKEPE